MVVEVVATKLVGTQKGSGEASVNPSHGPRLGGPVQALGGVAQLWFFKCFSGF